MADVLRNQGLDDTTVSSSPGLAPFAYEAVDQTDNDLGEHAPRLAEIEDALKAYRSDILAVADLVKEYHDLFRQAKNFEQNAQNKKKRGPDGVVKEMAQKLKMLPGETDEARRSWIQRTLVVAGLSEEVRTAARDAGLQRNRTVLTKIAKEADPKRQLELVEELSTEKASVQPKSKNSSSPDYKDLVVSVPRVEFDSIKSKLEAFADENGCKIKPAGRG